MTLKTKLISCISAFVLVISLMLVSIMAVPNVTLNIGGNVTFEATDVQATISNGILANGTLTDSESKMQEVVLDATHDGAEELATWSGLELAFNKSGEDMTITFSITNNHPEKDMFVEVTPSIGTQTNATMTVTSTSSDPISGITIPADGESETFTVTFHVESKNSSASIENFAINIALSSEVPESYSVNITNRRPLDPSQVYYSINGGEKTLLNETDGLLLENVRTLKIIFYDYAGGIGTNCSLTFSPSIYDSVTLSGGELIGDYYVSESQVYDITENVTLNILLGVRGGN